MPRRQVIQNQLASYQLLCVDDDQDRLQVIKVLFETRGYQVLTAATGVDALNVFHAKHIDLAIVDYYMPGMTGDIVATDMKRVKPDVPIVIFSGRFSLPEMPIMTTGGNVPPGTCDESMRHVPCRMLPVVCRPAHRR